MFLYKKWSTAAVIAAVILFIRPGFGAPVLTSIQDILYKADGTRFNGTVVINWTNFQAGDSSSVATQSVTVQVVNGVLRTQLIPTTNASAGAHYTVNYMSQGRFQFSETWAVPESSIPLRIRDVRASTGTVVGPPAVTTPTLIADITGLPNELSLRASKGPGFQPNRVGVINSSGLLDGAAGNAADCVHVDGTTGACGSGGGGGTSTYVAFVDGETPSGLVDGSNPGYALQRPPSPPTSLVVYRNGLLMRLGLDFTLAGASIAFQAGAIPQPGDVLQASYRTGDPTNALSSFTTAQVVCSSTGSSTSSASTVTLGSCSFPSGLLRTGDRIEIRVDFSHQGTSSGFTAKAAWGGSTILSASGTGSESILPARSTVAADTNGSLWTTEVLRSTPAVSSGSAPDDINAGTRIVFSGMLATGGADTLSLRNFTVLRYPAQSNP